MTLICILFGYGIAAAQNPKMEQVMNSKRKHIAEVAALTGKGDLDKLKPVLINGLNDGMTVGELKDAMYCVLPVTLPLTTRRLAPEEASTPSVSGTEK